MAFVIPIRARAKPDAAIEYRRKVVVEYERWYRGEIATLFGEPSPAPGDRVTIGTPRENAILTWASLHQQPKYLRTLRLERNALRKLTVLDVGSGGIPSGLAFADCPLLCLDPLIGLFQELGYPFRHYDSRARYLQGRAEAMPLATGSIDAIISVNALDHVDDLASTTSEIRRVLKRSGLLRLHVHYHVPTVLEPLALDDDAVSRLFSWCPSLRKLGEWVEAEDEVGGRHTLWSNYG